VQREQGLGNQSVESNTKSSSFKRFSHWLRIPSSTTASRYQPGMLTPHRSRASGIGLNKLIRSKTVARATIWRTKRSKLNQAKAGLWTTELSLCHNLNDACAFARGQGAVVPVESRTKIKPSSDKKRYCHVSIKGLANGLRTALLN